jgi:hypothetical protein
VHAAGWISTRLVKLIHVDDSGLRLGLPSGVRYDPLHDETYVYSSNQRITIYDKDYFPQGSIGAGRGVDELRGMAFDQQGHLYLAQGGTGSDKGVFVTVYNQALFVDHEILLNDIPELTGFQAHNLAVAANGDIYLVGFFPSTWKMESSHKGAAVLDSEGNFKKWLTPKTEVSRRMASGEEGDNGSLSRVVAPVALNQVTIDEQDRRYLLSTEASEIYVYDSSDEFLFKFGVKGGADGKLSTPKTVAVDYPRRLLYVVDYMRHTILAYDYDSGRFVFEFGGKGAGPLWFLYPHDIAVDRDGMVIVVDVFNRRVQVVDPTNPERPVISPRRPDSIGIEQPRPVDGSVSSPAAEQTPPPSPASDQEQAILEPLPVKPGGIPAPADREPGARLVAEQTPPSSSASDGSGPISGGVSVLPAGIATLSPGIPALPASEPAARTARKIVTERTPPSSSGSDGSGSLSGYLPAMPTGIAALPTGIAAPPTAIPALPVPEPAARTAGKIAAEQTPPPSSTSDGSQSLSGDLPAKPAGITALPVREPAARITKKIAVEKTPPPSSASDGSGAVSGSLPTLPTGIAALPVGIPTLPVPAPAVRTARKTAVEQTPPPSLAAAGSQPLPGSLSVPPAGIAAPPTAIPALPVPEPAARTAGKIAAEQTPPPSSTSDGSQSLSGDLPAKPAGPAARITKKIVVEKTPPPSSASDGSGSLSGSLPALPTGMPVVPVPEPAARMAKKMVVEQTPPPSSAAAGSRPLPGSLSVPPAGIAVSPTGMPALPVPAPAARTAKKIAVEQTPLPFPASDGRQALSGDLAVKPAGVAALPVREPATQTAKSRVVEQTSPPSQTSTGSGPLLGASPAKPPVPPAAEAGSGAGRQALRTVLGVYGPVVAMLGIGGWLLSRKR